MAEKVKENKMMLELGKWLMDIAKYVLTAVLISSLFSDVSDTPWMMTTGFVLVAIGLGVGLILVKRSSKTITKKKK